MYPLFQAGKSLSSKVFILEMKVYPLFQAGKSLSSKVFILEMKVYPLFFQAGKILALRAKNELSSVSGREG